MKTAEEIISNTPRVKDLCRKTRWNIQKSINTARIDTIKEVHGIVGAMDWDVMSNTIDAKELQTRLDSLINEIR